MLMYVARTTFFFFFNDTATTEIYTLSLHDALPISHGSPRGRAARTSPTTRDYARRSIGSPATGRTSSCCAGRRPRSEEHTSELQSRQYLVCRLLLEKKKNIMKYYLHIKTTHLLIRQ